MIILELPYPPSVNHYWGQCGNRRFVGKKGMEFRKAVSDVVADVGKKAEGRLQVAIALFPPDRRRRDVDNVQKSLNDALQHAGVFDDDEQIDVLLIERKEIVKGGKCKVVITEL